ncbi:MAG: hypothetical protein L0G99_03405 [Propionibacteriales bacterium]|nr:hypothetical protein [Propionibacteriales bacterium]
MTREIEIRLIGHQSADGELMAADAINLISSFRELAYRLTRSVVERPSLGRAPGTVERLAAVRVALRPGSTRVVFVVGDEAALLDPPVTDAVDETFWSIVEGVAENKRPDGVSDGVSDSVDDLVSALGKAAPQVEFRIAGRPSRFIRTATMSREPWRRRGREVTDEASLHGVLEMVDLHSSRFRLRDLAGNSVDLVDVVDALSVAHLVGEQVIAVGPLAVGQGTQHHRMEGPKIAVPEDLAARLGQAPFPNLGEMVQAAQQLPAVAAVDLTDEELDEFLAEIRG